MKESFFKLCENSGQVRNFISEVSYNIHDFEAIDLKIRRVKNFFGAGFLYEIEVEDKKE